MEPLRNNLDTAGVMAPIAEGWLGRIAECKRHKQPFNDVAKQCMEFFSGSMGFMWNQDFLGKYMGGLRAPRFRITICKAFELVALFGPTLYWRNPTRTVKPKQRKNIVDPQALMAALGPDPMGQQLVQALQESSSQRMATHSVVSDLMSGYLNYTPGEQPQGLAWHASQAITEALVKGRGCLWPMPYSPPNSDRVLTGCFYDSVDNLLIDPDATTLYDARYIVKIETRTVKHFEEEFSLPKGSLVGKGTYQSSWQQGERRMQPDGSATGMGTELNDLMTVYKVWSKVGVGVRMGTPQRTSEPLAEALEQKVGQYAYVVVAEGVKWPLNCNDRWMSTATDEEITRRFQWPVPYWIDNRWPVVPIDFYNRPNDPWAIAPLAPGLGELTFINVMMSALATKIYNTSRILIAGRESLGPKVESLIKEGDDLTYIPVAPTDGRLSDSLEMIQFPVVNSDVWEMLERTMHNFDRRTGITELLSGMNPGGKIARVAEDVRQRSEASSIRPEYMAARVEDALSLASEHEKLAARWFVQPQHLSGLYGPAEQWMWGRFINGTHPEIIAREFEATVVANSSRKPDRAKDMESFQQIAQFFLPFLTQYSMTAGDFEPVNGILRRWGEATDNPVDDMLINPEAMQQQMQQAQEQAQQESQMAQQEQQAQLQMKAQEHQMRMQQQMEKHQLQMQISAQQGQVKLGQSAAQLQTSEASSQQDLQQQTAKFLLETIQGTAKHGQQMRQSEEAHDQKLDQAKQQAAVQRKIAQQKPKPKPAGAKR